MGYRERFYEYQTICRGSLEPKQLIGKFDRMASYYKSRIGKYLPEDRFVSIVDVPCGYGNFLYFLNKLGYKNFSGYDLDPNQVRLAQSIGLPAFEKNIFDVFKSEKKYDVISSLDFLEHLSKDDALKFLDDCYKSLKTGGTLILRTPCADGFFGAHDASNDITHDWNMSSNMMKSILEMCGYKSIEILEERPQPENLIQIIRWLLYWPARWLFNLLCILLALRPPKVLSRSMIIVAHKE